MILQDFGDTLGVSRVNADNWQTRLDLSTEYAPTIRGVPRQYSRENVIELAVIAAFTKAGCPARRAAAYAAAVLRQDRGRQLKKWLIVLAGEFQHGRSTNDPSEVSLIEMAAMSPNQVVTLIHVGAIVATVDRLFAEKGSN